MIKVLREEILIVEDKRSEWTWVPVLDYFLIYRQSADWIGSLSREEVRCLTEAVHVYEERIGYVSRRGDRLSDSVPGNIFIKLNENKNRHWVGVDLHGMIEAAERAYQAVDKHLGSNHDGKLA